jgi:hypothetical protein
MPSLPQHVIERGEMPHLATPLCGSRSSEIAECLNRSTSKPRYSQAIAILFLGSDLQGHQFSEQAKTVILSGHGGHSIRTPHTCLGGIENEKKRELR